MIFVQFNILKGVK